ncbi:MAG: xylulokinase [Planctomycetes bacterium]|nr:xylulokinase [Planctomycetota bacterium]
MGGLWLGLDVGTQGTKGVVVDADADAICARASCSYDLIEGLEAGAAEQHPQTWIHAVRDVCAALREEVGPDVFAGVRGIGVSGQQHGLVVLDENDAVVRPAKLWCDTSTASEAAELSERFGRLVPTGFTASKVLWIQRREPEAWARVRSILLPHDYVNFVLTGDKTMEAGDASGSGFFDPVARRFDADEVTSLGSEVADMLPPLIDAGTPAGRLSAAGAVLTGIGEGALVASGSGDNMMSAVGSGATRAGVVVMSLGTSGTVFCHSGVPIVDPDGLIAPFCGATGGWLPLLCVMNLTGVLHAVADAVRPGDAAALDVLTEEAAGVEPGAEGLELVPYLVGERVPDLPDATGTLLGIRADNLRSATLFRAALEGTALNLAWGVGRMRELGIGVDSVRVVGGGARNPLWRRILADCLDAPVTMLAEPESGALGAALLAIWTGRIAAGDTVGCDEVARPFIREAGEPLTPDRVAVDHYADAQVRFRERVASLHG